MSEWAGMNPEWYVEVPIQRIERFESGNWVVCIRGSWYELGLSRPVVAYVSDSQLMVMTEEDYAPEDTAEVNGSGGEAEAGILGDEEE